MPVASSVSLARFIPNLAAHMLESGYDIRTIQELLGHRDPTTTRIYTHVTMIGSKGVLTPNPTRPNRKRGMTWEALLNWAADLPGVAQGICYGTPALYVRKRILARLREDGETVAIKIDFLDRDVLLEADPVAFFLTDHYRPYPMVVMRLKKARPAVAQGLLEQAWRRAAPKPLAAAHAVGEAPGEALADRPSAAPGKRRHRPTRARG